MEPPNILATIFHILSEEGQHLTSRATRLFKVAGKPIPINGSYLELHRKRSYDLVLLEPFGFYLWLQTIRSTTLGKDQKAKQDTNPK